MIRKQYIEQAKVLVTVKAYPKPSGTYEELVCTAGLLDGNDWVRIYPVPFRLLKGDNQYPKYAWIQLDLERRSEKDFRPESYRPLKGIHEEIKVIGKLGTDKYWEDRRSFVLKNVYSSMDDLIKDSRAPKNISLGVLKPRMIDKVIIEPTDREWPKNWASYMQENDLFEVDSNNNKRLLKKIPYNFYYSFDTEDEVKRKLKIEDWEIGALYLSCLKQSENDEQLALRKVEQKLYELAERDMYFFLGTTLQYHQRRALNPFIIIGLFYPPHNKQFTFDFS
jgi:hypothetical protein